jgi:hypothetical protein
LQPSFHFPALGGRQVGEPAVETNPLDHLFFTHQVDEAVVSDLLDDAVDADRFDDAVDADLFDDADQPQAAIQPAKPS